MQQLYHFLKENTVSDFGLSDRILQYLTQAASQFHDIDKLVLYGSRAMGNYKPGSDIDLCCMGSAVTGATIRRLHGLLNEELPIPYFVDVLAFDAISNEALKKHIVQRGIELYAKDPQCEYGDRPKRNA
jgi:predicted nucleotidyltransferase